MFYLTKYNDPSFGENPVIGLKYVHEFQAWIYRLTKKNKRISEI